MSFLYVNRFSQIPLILEERGKGCSLEVCILFTFIYCHFSHLITHDIKLLKINCFKANQTAFRQKRPSLVSLNIHFMRKNEMKFVYLSPVCICVMHKCFVRPIVYYKIDKFY
jgi:hypothetical protein